MAFINLVVYWLRYGLSILFPFFRSSSMRGVSAGVLWTLHAFVILGVLIFLFLLNRWLQIPRVIPDPQWAQPIWLPFFFLLLYALGWIALWLWRLLAAEEESSHFPDLDAAWDEAIRMLGQAGIRLTDAPMFLVLGRPESAEENLFQASQLGWIVKQAPADPRAPLHIYASRDAIFVTCPGASLLGKQAANLALEGIEEQAGASIAPFEEDPTKTLAPGGKEKRVIQMIKQAAGRSLTTLDRRVQRRAAGLGIPEILKNPPQVDYLSARLAHLCRLINRDRHPFCPINGVLWLIPLGGTDSEGDAQQIAEVFQRDLATVKRILKVQCPVFAMVCDLEDLPGFNEFITRLDAKELLRRLGQRFPLATDLRGEALQKKLEGAAHWLCQAMVPQWVFKLFRLEKSGNDNTTSLTQGNAHLYMLLDEIRERDRNLARILAQGFARETDGSLIFGGCYLAGTGPERQRAFVAGVFRRLLEGQNFVSWTDQALAEDAQGHNVARIGYLIVGGLVVAIIALGALLFFRR